MVTYSQGSKVRLGDSRFSSVSASQNSTIMSIGQYLFTLVAFLEAMKAFSINLNFR